MKKKMIGFRMLFLLTVLVLPWTVFAQPTKPIASCVGDSWPDGSYYQKGKQYSKVYNGKTYKCVGCGGCVPVGKQSVPYTGGYSSKQDFQMQMMHGIMGTLFQSIFSPSTGTSGQNEIAKQKAVKKILEEQQKQKAIEEWLVFQRGNKNLLGSFKGTQDQSHALKTSSADSDGLQLKTYAEASGKGNSGDALTQLKSIESSSEKAAQYAKKDSPETARNLSEFVPGKKDAKPTAHVPEKELTDKQIKARDRIIKETEALVSEIIETDKELVKTREAIEKTKAQAKANRDNAEKITSKLLKATNEAEKEKLKAQYFKINAEYDALMARVKTLEQNAEKLIISADKKRKKYEELKQRYNKVLSAAKTAK